MIIRQAYSRLARFVAARLSPESELGLHLTAGVLTLAAAVAVFAEIAEAVGEHDDIARYDAGISHWFYEHAFEPLTTVMFAITHLHGIPAMCVLSALLGVWFWRKGAPYWVLTTAIAVPGGMVLNVLLKHVYQRARPAFDEPFLTLVTYSFPSGHTAAATLFYGLLASYAVTVSPRWRVRCAAVAGAVFMVALVALSRVYLGAHFVSDVLAAMAESLAWLAFCITSVSTLRRRRAARKEQ